MADDPAAFPTLGATESRASDAVYRYGGDVGPHRDEDDATFATLSQHFFTTFPQLEGLRFSHRWGGAIDTCSRFSVFFGRAFAGRLVYALGGVFASQVDRFQLQNGGKHHGRFLRENVEVIQVTAQRAS